MINSFRFFSRLLRRFLGLVETKEESPAVFFKMCPPLHFSFVKINTFYAGSIIYRQPGIDDVLRMCNKPQIFKSIIKPISVNMVNFKSVWDFPKESRIHNAMNKTIRFFTGIIKRKMKISPSTADHGNSLFENFPLFEYVNGVSSPADKTVKRANPPKVGHFVSRMFKDWFPCFHRSSYTRFLFGAQALFIFFLLNGCGISVGPQVQREIVFVHPGAPCRIAEDVEVEVTVKKPDGTSARQRQNIGGWMTLPPDVYDAVKAALEAKK